jgi:molecular chaperone DnaK (HSP70)
VKLATKSTGQLQPSDIDEVILVGGSQEFQLI